MLESAHDSQMAHYKNQKKALRQMGNNAEMKLPWNKHLVPEHRLIELQAKHQRLFGKQGVVD